MALTKVSTDGVKDDAITSGKIPANAVGTSELADNAVDTNAIANNAVTAGKLASGITDLSNDTSPQLGGDLQSNGNDIDFADNDKAVFGTGGDLKIDHNGTRSKIENITGDLKLSSNSIKLTNYDDDETYLTCVDDGAVELFHDNNKKFSTTNQGAAIGQVSTIPTMSDFSCQILAGNSGFIGNFHSGSNQQFIIGLNQYYDGGYKAPDNNVSQQLQLYNKTFQFLTAPAAGSDNAAVTNTKILTIDDDGVKFGTDTAAANALNDYEEGTYTPTFSTGMSGISYTVQYGNYIKIGKLVRFDFHIQVNGGVSNAAIIAFTLPFNSDAGVNGHRGSGVITYSNINDGNQGTNGFPALYIGTSSAQCYMGASPWYGSSGSAQSNRYFIGGGTYHTP